MSRFASIPCCCAEEVECVLLSDDFERADSSDIGSNWTETAGSWSIASGNLATSSGTAFAKALATLPANNGVHIAVTVSGSSSGDRARVIVNYADSSNFTYAEIKFGTGSYIRLCERVAGTNSVLKAIYPSLSTGTDYDIIICYSGMVLSAEYSTFKVFADVTLDGGDFGVGTGTMFGTVNFDSFVANQIHADCETCPTPEPPCVRPDEFDLTIPTCGWLDQDCDQCDELATTFRLKHQGGNLWTYTEDHYCGNYLLEIILEACSSLLHLRVGNYPTNYSECKWTGSAISSPATYTKSIIGENHFGFPTVCFTGGAMANSVTLTHV